MGMIQVTIHFECTVESVGAGMIAITSGDSVIYAHNKSAGVTLFFTGTKAEELKRLCETHDNIYGMLVESLKYVGGDATPTIYPDVESFKKTFISRKEQGCCTSTLVRQFGENDILVFNEGSYTTPGSYRGITWDDKWCAVYDYESCEYEALFFNDAAASGVSSYVFMLGMLGVAIHESYLSAFWRSNMPLDLSEYGGELAYWIDDSRDRIKMVVVDGN